ncbi:MAG: hypothetical protein ABJD13_20730 [Paracoccaceae bacterium]
MDNLKFVLRLNAASCISFGLLFVVAPQVVAAFLGSTPPVIIFALGVGLFGNGAFLIAASLRKTLRKGEVIWFSLGDLGWWLATLGLIAAKIWITTTWGIILAVIVATIVAGLGVAQLWNIGLQAHNNTSKQHVRAIVTSWMALPMWVKIWLVVLNGVFLSALALLPDRVAEVTLIAYVATVPLLAGQLGYDGGLRRILSVAHLVPWIPLVAWLVIIPEWTSYTVILTLIVSICLAFDINDLRLFVKGERDVLGAGDYRS